MEEKLDVRAIERGVMTRFHADGIMEIFVGLMLSLIWVAKQFDMVVFIAILPALMIPVIRKVKRKITFPRIGYVDVKGRGNHIGMLKMLFALGVLVLGVTVFAVAKSEILPQGLKDAVNSNVPLVFSLVFAAIFSVMASVLTVKRFYIYAALTVIFINSAGFLGYSPMKSLSIIGLIMLIAGFTTLRRFISENPILPAEVIGEEE